MEERSLEFLELDERQWLELANGATAGPWWQQSHKQTQPPVAGAHELSDLLCNFTDEDGPRFYDWENDGEFVAAARTALPTCLARIAALRQHIVDLGRQLPDSMSVSRLEAESAALRQRCAELEADLAATNGEPHADRCAQSRRLKIQCAAADARAAGLQGEVERLRAALENLRQPAMDLVAALEDFAGTALPHTGPTDRVRSWWEHSGWAARDRLSKALSTLQPAVPDRLDFIGSSLLKIIRGGMSGDRELVRNYAVFIAQTLGQSRLADAIRLAASGAPQAAVRTMDPQPTVTLTSLCAEAGFLLLVDPYFHDRPDVIGQRAASPHAQLCTGRVIAVAADSPDAVFSVSHELAHGLFPESSEETVRSEQMDILAGWARRLMSRTGATAVTPNPLSAAYLSATQGGRRRQGASADAVMRRVRRGEKDDV